MDKNTSSNVSATSQAVKGIHSQTLIVIIKSVFSLTYFSIMSRLLTPEDFGYYALITAVTTIISSISEAGLGSSVIQKKEASNDYINTAYTLSIASGTIFSIILFTLSGAFSKIVIGSDYLKKAFQLMTVILICQSINNVSSALFYKNLKFFHFGIIQICADIISYAVGVMYALNNFGFYSIVAAIITNYLSLTLILLCIKKIRFKPLIKKTYVKEIFSYGGWLTASVIVRNLTNEIDKLIIGKLLPITDLGAINRPQGFINRISSQVNGIFDIVLFPILSSIQNDKNKIERAYIKTVTLAMTCSFIMGSFMAIGANLIIEIFFGKQWLNLNIIFIIFSLAAMLHGYSRIADSFFRSLGIVKLYFLSRLINWVVLIACVIIGCMHGILGATIGMVSGTVISCVIKFIMQKNAVKVKPNHLLKSIIRNIWFPVILLVLILIIKSITTTNCIIYPVVYTLLLIISIIYFPSFYGEIFNSIIIDKYFKKFKRFRIY